MKCKFDLLIKRLPLVVESFSVSARLCSNSVCSAVKWAEMIRNVGIMAHIDAGKTTATERFLYHAGITNHVGEVHRGNTVMDFMDEERNRGITIQSAAINFPWKSYQINLIDTPGHVDFTIEVERSLRVLDGALLILDGSAGVQPQTMTVWRQANRYDIPRIAFINKMDKFNADLQRSLNSIRSKLKVSPLLIQLPIYFLQPNNSQPSQRRKLIGVVDLIHNKVLIYTNSDVDFGQNFTELSLEEYVERFNQHDVHPSIEEIESHRSTLIDSLADMDDDLATHLMSDSGSYQNVSPIKIESILADITRKQRRRSERVGDNTLTTFDSNHIVTLVGSAFKNVGVQPVLDAIVKYLPPPQRFSRDGSSSPVSSHATDECKSFCGLAFKIIHRNPFSSSKSSNSMSGSKSVLPHLTYFRVYSGSVCEGDKLFNVRSGELEIVDKVFIPHGGELKVTHDKVGAGHTAVILGWNSCKTGDVYLANKSMLSSHIFNSNNGDCHRESSVTKTDLGRLISESIIEVPSPVFYCSIESASPSQEKPLSIALQNLSREDPSLRVSVDPVTSQTVLSGMGELHLQIVFQRILNEYKVEAFMGDFMVAYRETITQPCRVSNYVYEKMFLGKNYEIMFDLELQPALEGEKANIDFDSLRKTVNTQFKHGSVVMKKSPSDDSIHSHPCLPINNVRERMLKSTFNSFLLAGGPILHFPLESIHVKLHYVTALVNGSSSSSPSSSIPDSILSSAFTEALKQAVLCGGRCRLLEPVMRLSIITNHASSDSIMRDLCGERRGVVLDVDVKFDDTSNSNDTAEDYGSRECEIVALAPISQLKDYSSSVRRLTSGEVFFGMEFDHYQLVDSDSLQNEIVSEVTGFDV